MTFDAHGCEFARAVHTHAHYRKKKESMEEGKLLDLYEEFLKSTFSSVHKICRLIENNWFNYPLFKLRVDPKCKSVTLPSKKKANSASNTNGTGIRNSSKNARSSSSSERGGEEEDIMFKDQVGNEFIAFENPERYFYMFAQNILMGRCELSIDSNGVYFISNRSFFIPFHHMNKRELEICEYWIKHDKLLFRHISSKNYFLYMSSYVFDEFHVHIPVYCSWNILCAFHCSIMNKLNTTAWPRYWKKDSRLSTISRLPEEAFAFDKSLMNPVVEFDEYMKLQSLQSSCNAYFFSTYRCSLVELRNDLNHNDYFMWLEDRTRRTLQKMGVEENSEESKEECEKLKAVLEKLESKCKNLFFKKIAMLDALIESVQPIIDKYLGFRNEYFGNQKLKSLHGTNQLPEADMYKNERDKRIQKGTVHFNDDHYHHQHNYHYNGMFKTGDTESIMKRKLSETIKGMTTSATTAGGASRNGNNDDVGEDDNYYYNDYENEESNERAW